MLNKLLYVIFHMEFRCFAAIYKNAFRSCGNKFRLQCPLYLTPSFIDIGNQVMIWRNARIEAVSKYNRHSFNPSIVLDDGVSIQQNVHITCASKVYIGKETALAANVSITDINHPYKDINIAPEKQDIETEEVHIGPNCKLYNNVVILPGVRLGMHCVVGANSVVRKGDYPDYTILAGNPARIIKKYNFQEQKWEGYDHR